MLTACLSMMLHLLLLLIRIAIKLRLSIPLVYLVLMLTVFQPWYRAHMALADGIFLALVGCTVLSWIISFVRFFAPHGGRTRRLCGADLHGCAVGP